MKSLNDIKNRFIPNEILVVFIEKIVYRLRESWLRGFEKEKDVLVLKSKKKLTDVIYKCKKAVAHRGD